MSRRINMALRGLERARPSSGFRPETEAEWLRLQAAHVRLAAVGYQSVGASRAEALRLAKLIHGGAAGRLILELAFQDDPPEGSA